MSEQRALNPHVTAERWRDPQYAAAFYIFARFPECFQFVIREGIDKAGLLKAIRAWSHGEQVMVKIELDLFDPGCVREFKATPAGWGEAVNLLDAGNMKAVFDAMRIARGELRVRGDLAAVAP